MHDNGILNCPVIHDDSKVVDAIWGKDDVSLKGKTIWSQLPEASTDTIVLPPNILNLQMHVTLMADLIFSNKLALVVSLSQGIWFSIILCMRY